MKDFEIERANSDSFEPTYFFFNAIRVAAVALVEKIFFSFLD